MHKLHDIGFHCRLALEPNLRRQQYVMDYEVTLRHMPLATNFEFQSYERDIDPKNIPELEHGGPPARRFTWLNCRLLGDNAELQAHPVDNHLHPLGFVDLAQTVDRG